jgi:hypothetical protein
METIFTISGFAFFIGLILSPWIIFDKNHTNKDNIILNELSITLFPIIIVLIIVGRKVNDNEISSFLGFVMFLMTPTLVYLLIKLYNKKRFKKIDEINMRIVSNQIEWDRKVQENRRIKKERYMEALQNGDKSNALQLGRDYYSSLGLYDEQRIQNDLLCFLKLK